MYPLRTKDRGGIGILFIRLLVGFIYREDLYLNLYLFYKLVADGVTVPTIVGPA